MTSATISFTIPNRYWLTSNMRFPHWAMKRERVKYLRRLGYATAKSDRTHQFRKQVRVTAWIGYSTNVKADPINASEAGKPLIDGLVDAGVFVDDSHEWVIGPDYRRDPVKAPKGHHTLRLEIEEVE